LFPHAFQYARRQRLPLLAVLLCPFALWGCSLFPGDESHVPTGPKRSLLQPLQAAPDAVQVDICQLERPAEDPLLASEIWREVDEHGDLTLETLETLRENGFRIGHFSSNPPPSSIQKLLGMVADIPTDSSGFGKPLMGIHRFVSPGIDTEIATGIERDQCDFELHDKDGAKTLEYQKMNCVFRMKARRLQDGWVRVDFQPEIHHGERQLRRIPTEHGFSLKSQQNIDPLLGQRFSVTMNVGETMLITAAPGHEGTLGDRFFRQDVGGDGNQRVLKRQRVLFIRITDAGKS
jgi:hypothetical protein